MQNEPIKVTNIHTSSSTPEFRNYVKTSDYIINKHTFAIRKGKQ